LIEYVKGDFFDYKADIRINTVNCVGVMGTGVALEFKNKYPEMYKSYVDICKRKEIAPGNPFVWKEYNLFSSCIIINLPTKLHWRKPSEYDYIERNLIWLRNFLKNRNNETVVTLPALGCGHGGLNWDIVKDKINYYLSDLSAQILVFEPASSNKHLTKIDYRTRLQEDKVITLYPNDEKFPSILKDNYKKEIYCKGNTQILNYKRISLILGNTISEKESTTIFKILAEIKKDNIAIIINLNNKKQLELAKMLLEKDYKLIMIIPYGILQFKYASDLIKHQNKYVLLSFLSPMQEFKKYEYINSLKNLLVLANVVLCCCENIKDIEKYIDYLKGYENLFYIYYGKSIEEIFNNLNAKRIGIDPKTKKPRVIRMQQILDMERIN